MPGKGTLVSFTLNSNTSNDWTANIQQSTGRDVEISVTTDVDCIVGEWRMTIDVLSKDSPESSRYIHKKPVYVLFNPWCKGGFIPLRKLAMQYKEIFFFSSKI